MRVRSGFTLVELLVVIAIIGILIALLLPAVQAAREAGRRMQCINHVKQMVLAMHTYHDSHKTLPLNYKRSGYAETEVGTSWMIGILPYIEQRALFDRYQFDRPVGDPQNLEVIKTVIPTFLCPSDSASFASGHMEGDYTAPCCNDNRWWIRSQTAMTDYKACAGANWCWGDFNVSNPQGRHADNCDGFSHANGIIGRNWGLVTITRLRDVTDGTTKTFAIGEAVAFWCGWSNWAWSNGCTGTCAIPPNYRTGMVDLHGVWDDWSRNYSFFSMHPDGLNFGMCDGSAHFISDAIDIHVYRALATISSEEIVQVP
jgi:prepilin-type N-terminal cleavage/methylation domain-containing protein/prepilin-type processing-associated H-X9-DG protein